MTWSEDQEFRLAVIELEKVVSHPDPDIRDATLKPALRFIIRTGAFRAKWQINLCHRHKNDGRGCVYLKLCTGTGLNREENRAKHTTLWDTTAKRKLAGPHSIDANTL